jgi:hypothetical protein
MEQRQEWREKSGGVLEEAEETGAENEVEDAIEDVGEIGADGEGSCELAAGAGVARAAACWAVA